MLISLEGVVGAGKTSIRRAIDLKSKGHNTGGMIPDIILEYLGDQFTVTDDINNIRGTTVLPEWVQINDYNSLLRSGHQIVVFELQCSNYMQYARLMHRANYGLSKSTLLRCFHSRYEMTLQIDDKLNQVPGLTRIKINTDDVPGRVNAKYLDLGSMKDCMKYQVYMRSGELDICSDFSRMDYDIGRFNEVLPEDMTGMTVCDVGCNAGAFSFESVHRGALFALAVDNCARDERHLEFIRSLRNEWKVPVSVQKADITKDEIMAPLSWFRKENEGRWDLVLLLNVLHRITGQEPVYRKFLRQADRVIMETPVRMLERTDDEEWEDDGWRNPVGARWGGDHPSHCTVPWVERVSKEEGFEITKIMPTSRCPQRLIFDIKRTQ